MPSCSRVSSLARCTHRTHNCRSSFVPRPFEKAPSTPLLLPRRPLARRGGGRWLPIGATHRSPTSQIPCEPTLRARSITFSATRTGAVLLSPKANGRKKEKKGKGGKKRSQNKRSTRVKFCFRPIRPAPFSFHRSPLPSSFLREKSMIDLVSHCLYWLDDFREGATRKNRDEEGSRISGNGNDSFSFFPPSFDFSIEKRRP